MARRSFRIWHHWLSVVGGVFLLSYSITGLWHIPRQYIPWIGPDPSAQAPPPLDLNRVRLSAEDVLAMAQEPGQGVEIRSLSLRPIGDHAVYDLRSSQGRMMVDAETGAPFQVTAAVAESIVRQRYALGEVALESERIEQPSYQYLNGPLPAFLFHDPENPSRIYSVTESDGGASASSRGTRINRYIRTLHALRPTRELTGSVRVQHLSMLSTTLLCILLAGTGFFLILPLPKLRRARRVPGAEEKD